MPKDQQITEVTEDRPHGAGGFEIPSLPSQWNAGPLLDGCLLKIKLLKEFEGLSGECF